MNDLTQTRVHELLDYYPTTGILKWRKSGKGRRLDLVAGSLRANDGYIEVRVDYTAYLAHRLIWFGVIGKWPNPEVDHVNLIRNDNRWVNLREADKSQNGLNRIVRADNQSGFKGVCLDKRSMRWVAQLSVNKKHHHIGRFDTPEEASAAYIAAVAEHCPEFGRAS